MSQVPEAVPPSVVGSDPAEQAALEALAEEQGENIYDLLADIGGPGEAQIERWKAQFGDVLVTAFDPRRIFVWRTLTRREYRQMQAMLQTPEAKIDQFDYEEMLVKTCVLWPALDEKSFADGKGGTPSTLAEQIMQNSDFFNPVQASALVMKL